jgi:FlaA1/EpsC-like NDP-sugar epimerase
MLTVRTLLFAITDQLTRTQKRAFLFLIDFTLAPLALLFATIVVHNGMPSVTSLHNFELLFPAVSLLAAVASVMLRMSTIKLNAYESQEIIRTGIMAFGVTLGVALIVQTTLLVFPRPGIILFGLFFFLLSVSTRIAMLHFLLWVLRAGKTRRRVLIYGAGNTGTQLAAALLAHDTILPVAFVDDSAALRTMTIAGLRVYGPDQMAEVITNLEVERVLLAMPSVSAPKVAQIAKRLQDMGLAVMSVPSFAQLIGVEQLVDALTPIEPDKFLGRVQVDSPLPQGGEVYQGRKVLVTGAGGSVGSELCRQLLRMRPSCIVLYEVSEIALYSIERELSDLALGTDIEICAVLGSVTDSRLARAVMTNHDIEIVFHAAAYKHVPLVEANPIAGLANNVLGTRILGDAANATGVKKFVLISTDKAVRPCNIMGASKRLAELVVQDLAKRSSGTVFSMVRFGNVLGSSGSVIPLFREQIERGGPVTLTHEDVTRYFMTLSEAARLLLLAGSFADGTTSRGGDVFVLDMGKPVKIRDLAQQMIEAAGYTLRDALHPDGDIEIVVTGLRPGEKLHEELLIGEGLLTTPHQKILRAKEHCLSELEMASALRALRSSVASGSADEARSVVHRYVEGYQRPNQVAVA